MSQDTVEELDGSQLGTKEYWDKSYVNEIENYKSFGDVGEIWFDEDSQIRVINWLLKNDIPAESRIIDLGCGNGMMLIELAREGYKTVTGIDYSANAIELSKCIAADQELDIDYHVLDLLNSENVTEVLGSRQFDIVHDKGTYDAVSLNPDHPQSKRTSYIENVHKILDNNGLFVLTSCNWTEEELITSFSGRFAKYRTIPTPTFRFGGKSGSVITQVVFKKIPLNQ